MEDLKRIIVQFVEENEEGNINDIIKYLFKKNIKIQESLSKIQESVEIILKSLNNVKFSDSTKNFYFIQDFQNSSLSFNEFSSYQDVIVGRILNNEEKEIDFSLFYQYLNEKVYDLGKLSLTDPNQKINIDGFFDTEIVQASFQINQNQFTIRSMMKSINVCSEPLLNFISKLSNRSVKREKSIYIPLNYGLFLVYENFKLFLNKYNPNIDIVIDVLEYTH